MLANTLAKTPRWGIFALKVGIFVSLLCILYYQMFHSRQMTMRELAEQIHLHTTWASMGWLVVAAALLPLNWAVEVWKWQPFMQTVEPMPFCKALRAVLAGLTLSLFTPNRVGEYGGRVLLVEASNRGFAVYTTLIGNLAQWIILLTGGLIAYASWQLFDPTPLPVWLRVGLFAAGIALWLALLSLYFYNARILRLASRWQRLARWLLPLHEQVARYHTPHELGWLLAMATARYTIYSIQYFLMLQWLGVEISVFIGFTAIALIYFLQTGLPLPPSTGLVARGNIALLIFDQLAPHTPAMHILAATGSLWLLNILLPALVGALVVGGVLFGRK